MPVSVFCDLEGKRCSGDGSGVCLEDLGGCECTGRQYGEYCQFTYDQGSFASHTTTTTLLQYVVVVVLALWFTL